MARTIVVDCSVAAKWVLPEPQREAALEWMEKRAADSVNLIAPDLLMAEFASLLSKRQRRKQLEAVQAAQAFQLMSRCAPRLYETTPLLARALHLSMRCGASLWDSVYAALAEEHGAVFLTADRRLFRGGTGRLPRLVLLGTQGPEE